MWAYKEWIEQRLGIITLQLPCTMCSCQHKIHWSVVAIIVNVVCLVLSTTGISTDHWAVKTESGYSIHSGLFQACKKLNDTCYDTHTYFADHEYEKGLITASAVLNVFSLIGFYFFFALSVFFLCGLYEEKKLATGAVITSYVSGLFAIIGIVMYAVSIKRLSFSLSWSFILAVMGFVVNIAAGVLMCVGRNISTKKRIKKKRTADSEHPVEEIQMDDTDTTRKKVWSSRDGPEVSANGPDTRRKLKFSSGANHNG
ncbi:uncharacterized protein LOC123540303 isoform X1 [Mercenaria mercenaria]|uniref:uncharacterized protein LOC123540303 isoform X1 n=2 Tax=Mercenaria mercenaria TaxID=6596 RepID=UPI001E1D7FAE|nr:uncharacterized protein LOC123540303 isoform X1 [Mercenaria mercenaria]